MQTQTAPERTVGFWQSVRESLSGAHHDYTEGNLNRAILLLAVPMVLEMVMESLFGLVDVFFVAHLGEDATSAVGLTEAMLVILFAIAMGLAMATTAMVARRIGEKDTPGASRAAVQAILLATGIGLTLGVLGAFNAQTLLTWMGASPGVIALGTTYTRITMASSFIIVLLFVNNAIFRGAGDPAIAMRTLWFANAINIVLGPCLITGIGPFPQLGVTGTAVATMIGRGLGVVYQFYLMLSGSSRVKLSFSAVRIDPDSMRRLIRIASTGMIQYLVATASWMALVRLVARFGSSAVAGYTIAIRIIIFALLPSWGLSNAAATLVGQNLGAQKPDRAERSVWQTGTYNMIFLGLVTIVFVAFAPWIISIFTPDPVVQGIGVSCLRMVSYGYVFYAWGMVMVQAFNGAGDTRTPTLINLACYWLWQLPLAYFTAIHFQQGVNGIFLAIPIAESTLALLGMLAFRRGSWKRQVV
jgi:putative MATE family efflux protein